MGEVIEGVEAKQSKKWKKIDEEWRSSRLSEKNDQKLFEEICNEAMQMIAMELAKQFDEHLNSLKEELSTANKTYTDAKKLHLTKMEFLMEALRGRGCTNVPSLEDFLKGAATPAAERKTQAEFKTQVKANLIDGFGKTLNQGESITISTPDGKSVTITGKGKKKAPVNDEITDDDPFATVDEDR